MGFRKDINGLRAIAVMIVVLFHFMVPGMEGGFVGVDVFFVISGFLMTAIIFGKLDNQQFSLGKFYLDRVRRIVPALAVLCLAVLLVGWFLLLPERYEALGTDVLSSVVFLSNIHYGQAAGYFETASHERWLLHTWSLSVEWQFYMLYPLVLLGLSRLLGREQIRWLIFLGAAASFALSVYASSRWPTSAFFLLPTRAWEMLAGGLIFLFPLRVGARRARQLEWAGLALIAGTTLTVSEADVWPGWLAAIPVIGTAMIIAGARADSFVTGNRVSQFLGKTSYSIYLWHWPVAVWINYFGLTGDPLWIAVGIAASILLGYLSFTLVESYRPRPVRRPRLALPVGLSAFPLLTGAAASTTLLAKGYPERFGEDFQQATEELVMPSLENGWCFYDLENIPEIAVGAGGLSCALGAEQGAVKGLLFGDSFAGHYGPFWDEMARGMSAELNAISTNWCYPSLTDEFTGRMGRGYEQCLINREYLRQHVGDYDLVVFAGSWGSIHDQEKMDGVYSAIELAAQQTELVVLMAAPTNFDINVTEVYKRSLLFDLEFDVDALPAESDSAAREANQQLKWLAGDYDNVVFISRESLFNVDGVPSEVSEENIPFALDQSGHISVYGAKQAVEAFRNSRSFGELQRDMAQLRAHAGRAMRPRG